MEHDAEIEDAEGLVWADPGNVAAFPEVDGHGSALAAEAGADAVTLINTVLAMAVDWRQQRPLLGNVVGGLSGPAIKPIALRAVYQVSQAVSIPVVGIGGIATVDDVLEFAVAGATAIQVGTANFFDPTCSIKILDALPAALSAAGIEHFSNLVGTLQTN